MKPLTAVEGTAEAIANGDLSARLPDAKPNSEVGRLTTSLNRMLSRIEDSFSIQRRSEEKLRRFVADASHELRTPLASLIGFIETLQGPARDDPKAQARFLSIMREQGRRMARLIDDLLSLARVEMSEHKRPLETVDLTSIIQQSVDTLRPMASQRGVTLEIKFSDHPALIPGDRDELMRVVENLIENGIKYGHAGGRVEIDLQPHQGESSDDLALSIRDFGDGIATEHLPRLTERFYRVDASASRESGGTGLGLAIVKHIVNRHRGELRITSAIGIGSTFTVLLPAVEPDR